MMSATMRTRLAILVLLAALPLRAMEVRGALDEPRDGAVLRGGTTATIAWSSRELPRFAEEWEAFLSADGGGHYAYRITPHLDLAHKRFTFVVPNVETEHARILIRAGDERREVEVQLEEAFSIRQDRLQAATTAATTLDEEKRGEAARPGEAGVIEWIDGDRDGGHLATRSALRDDASMHATAQLVATTDNLEVATTAPALAAQAATSDQQLLATRAAARACIAIARAGRDVLLASRRLNV